MDEEILIRLLSVIFVGIIVGGVLGMIIAILPSKKKGG